MSKGWSTTDNMEFQFLIGSLVTKLAYGGYLYPNAFQFLIGSLVTVITELILLQLILVSIPYR